jgi:hypothetical protein
MGQFYKEGYPDKLAFLQAFADARYEYEDIHKNALQVMAEPNPNDLRVFIFYTFISRLFIGGEIEGENESGKKILLDYYPETLGETEIAMILELAGYCKLTEYNKKRGWPSTNQLMLLDWLHKNQDKEIVVVFA